MERGVNISPVGFLVIKEGNVRLITVDTTGPLDKLVDIVPDVINKANDLIKKGTEDKEKVLKISQQEKMENK